ncbi:hypothetical protein JCGZ_03120 [Jatropha curcas]|uniref:Uncharacterized protein n=1 Tax=Jatropha curcas TaxID=180498 RepID=A0A067JDN3_JATCU|nr:hypothetical protein JCGZ_03120 [Jatropha curcas]
MNADSYVLTVTSDVLKNSTLTVDKVFYKAKIDDWETDIKLVCRGAYYDAKLYHYRPYGSTCITSFSSLIEGETLKKKDGLSFRVLCPQELIVRVDYGGIPYWLVSVVAIM